MKRITVWATNNPLHWKIIVGERGITVWEVSSFCCVLYPFEPVILNIRRTQHLCDKALRNWFNMCLLQTISLPIHQTLEMDISHIKAIKHKCRRWCAWGISIFLKGLMMWRLSFFNGRQQSVSSIGLMAYILVPSVYWWSWTSNPLSISCLIFVVLLCVTVMLCSCDLYIVSAEFAYSIYIINFSLSLYRFCSLCFYS